MNILIENWKADERNTRQGYVSLTLPDYGLTIRDCVLHLSNGRHWLAFPAREYTNRDGEKKWWAHISFADRAQGDAFQQAAIDALRKHSPGAFGLPKILPKTGPRPINHSATQKARSPEFDDEVSF